MSSRKITDSVYSVGVLNPNLRVFDIVMKTDYGTSYNSYLVRGEKTALIETCHHAYFDEYMENIREVCDPSEIDVIILNHTEPDHSGILARLTESCPKAEIYCSKAASIYLKAITNKPDLSYHVVKDGETLDLGGKTLQFISAPFLHWPDSMFTWLREEDLLFTCDFLGSHYCEPRGVDAYLTYPAAYEESFLNYYAAIFGPFPSYVRQGLTKLSETGAKIVCPSHGPVLTAGNRLEYAVKKYEEWSAPKKNAVPLIPIFYCTAYGNTRTMAEQMKQGIENVLPDADVRLYDIIAHDMGELGAVLNASDAFMIGSPTLNREAVPPVWQLLSHIDAINIQKRPCAVFGSFGWSGEAVPNLCQRLSAMKLRVFAEGLKVNFVPSAEEKQKCIAFAEDFARSLDF